MPTLHLVNHTAGLSSALEIAAVNDVILLIEEAAQAAFEISYDRPLLVLQEHLPASDADRRLPPTVSRVDFDRFVELVTECQPIVSWH